MIKLHYLASAIIYLFHLDTKKPVKVTFYAADKSGSTLLSCAMSLKLDLIKPHPKLGVPSPRAKIITSQADWASPAAKRITLGKVVFDKMQSTVQEPLVTEKWARYQNNQHNEISSLVPKSAPYECSKCAEQPKCFTIQPHHSTHHSKEITSLYSITRYTKMFSSTSREKCTLWDLLSTANSPTNSTASNIFRVHIYWKTQKQ